MSKSPVGIAELKAHLSQHLERVKQGQEVLITEHGVPVARIVPVLRDSSLNRLVAQGIVRLPAGKPPAIRPRHADAAGRMRAALLAERESGY